MIAELLYTRVEPDFSPLNRGGWQCVQADGDCMRADLERLVDAAAIWESGLPKTGNFRVEGDRWLRVYVAPLDPGEPHYNEVVDRSYRGGVSIFHAFVYQRGEGEPLFPSPIGSIQALVERIEELRGTPRWDYRHPVLTYGGRQ